MLNLDCPFCKARLEAAAQPTQGPLLCRECGRCPASATSAAALPHYSAYGMLPGARQAKRDDDDDDDDGDAEIKPKPKKRSGGSDAAIGAAAGAGAAAGIGLGMILAIVGGVAACCLCIFAIPIGFALMVPALQKSIGAQDRVQKINNAKQIALACHSFHDAHKLLPSPRMQPQNPGGKAADLSWRVSILPYLEQQALFAKYDKTQDWDGPKNHPNQIPMPSPYGTGSLTKTQYFTGPNTLFPEPLSKKMLVHITDGTSNVFLFAEAAAPVAWAKQDDMAIANGPLPLPEGKFLAAMADATARVVNRKNANDDVLRMLINPTDGQPLPAGWDRE